MGRCGIKPIHGSTKRSRSTPPLMPLGTITTLGGRDRSKPGGTHLRSGIAGAGQPIGQRQLTGLPTQPAPPFIAKLSPLAGRLINDQRTNARTCPPLPFTIRVMSRTKRGGKAPGYEPWSARPFNKHGGVLGKYHKKRTHKAERREGKIEREEEVWSAINLH